MRVSKLCQVAAVSTVLFIGGGSVAGAAPVSGHLSWDRVTHHESALEHWTSSDDARHKTGTPPKGAFVFWAIPVKVEQNYFNSYQGWKPGNDN